MRERKRTIIGVMTDESQNREWLNEVFKRAKYEVDLGEK